jgi:uncharacterized protein
MIAFEWDEHKAALNLKKHGVSFGEAQTAFFDDFADQYFDESHSYQEDRFILLGLSSSSRLLVVCHYEQVSDKLVRIISARKATKTESRSYRGA